MSADFCPFCASTEITTWSLGKLRCRSCGRAFSRREMDAKKPPQNNCEDIGPRRTGARSTRAQADRQERRVAKRLDARQTIASGQTPIDKGDVRSDEVRVECKYTDAASFSLKAADLEKVAEHAAGNQIPLFFVEFRKAGNSYYVVPEDWFLQLMEAWRAQNQDD